LALPRQWQVTAHGFRRAKLRMHPNLGNPTVMIVVDRIDLDTQITATFNAPTCLTWSGVHAPRVAAMLAQDVRKF